MGNSFKYFVTVQFPEKKKEYHFGCNDKIVNYGDFAVVETANGLEFVEVISQAQPIDLLPGKFELKPVVRKANRADVASYKQGLEKGKEALRLADKHINDLKLDMNLISADFTLDQSKVLIVYVAEGRVDFRELLKRLSNDLKCRIELRQIGARDKAKLIGGVAPCGMETCCSRFMNDFEMVSINMAKNQNLALNIPKLSGMCGKFKCCLRHEDEAYTEIKKGMPEVYDKVMFKGNLYTITSLNLISGQMRLSNDEETIMTTVEEAVTNNPQFKTKEELREQRQRKENKERGRNVANK